MASRAEPTLHVLGYNRKGVIPVVSYFNKFLIPQIDRFALQMGRFALPWRYGLES